MGRARTAETFIVEKNCDRAKSNRTAVTKQSPLEIGNVDGQTIPAPLKIDE